MMCARGRYEVVRGHTVAADCFYEGQGRLDGALPVWYTAKDRDEFLRRACALGCSNIEMEATSFLSFFQRLGAPAAICDATLLNRLEGDQVTHMGAVLTEWSLRPQDIAIAWLKNEKVLA